MSLWSFTWPVTMSFLVQHCQHNCLVYQRPRSSWMADPRQMYPKGSAKAKFWPWLIPWIKDLGSVCLGATIQVHSWFRNPRQLCWWRRVTSQFDAVATFQDLSLYHSIVSYLNVVVLVQDAIPHREQNLLLIYLKWYRVLGCSKQFT